MAKQIAAADVKKIVIACEAGMGSSVMVVHKGLAKMAFEKAPWAVIIPFDNFMNIPVFDKIIAAIQNNGTIKGIG